MQGLEPRSQELFDVFISYAHADDVDGHVSDFVKLLREVRDRQQYRSWQIFFDQKAIEPGDDWQQRLARVTSAGALIVLLSPNYFRSEWCRKEWQGFREQEQKPPCLDRVFPIYLQTDNTLEDHTQHDDWSKDLARRQRLDLRDIWTVQDQVRKALERLERLISDRLKDHAHQRQFRRLGIPYQSIPLPPYFVPRPDDLARVREALLSTEAGPGLVMSAVFGMGGIGKTTLAADLVRQADVRDHFEDGIVWATLGQNPEVRSLLSQWIIALGDHNFRSSEAGDYQTHLRSLLQSKKMLLVIDDAWSSDHVNWFRVGGERCRVLVTTRDQGIARSIHATSFDLDVMTPEQSQVLITGRLGRPLREDEQADAAALADDVGRLPLALELIASQVADGIPWDELREDLRGEVARLRSLDLPNADEPVSEEERKKRSLIASVNLSLGRLTAVRRERFAWLGVVPDDAVVNPVMTATLWNVDQRTARDELRYLREKALLLAAPVMRIGEKEHPGYRLHDLLHDAALHLLTSPKQPEDDRQLPGLGLELPAAHAELLSRYSRRTQNGQWHTLPEDGYIPRRLAWHFEQARDVSSIHAMLREEMADGRNGWFEANDRRGEMAVFADDVARAWRLAEEGWRAGQPAPVLGLQVRYALVTGSLNQMAGNLQPELIEALVQKRIWPPAQGLAYANRIPKPEDRADALTRLAPLFPEAERGGVLAAALADARQLSQEQHRSEALVALAPHLNEALLAQALADARQIRTDYYRSRALGALAQHLSKAQRTKALEEALATARQISNESPRFRLFAALAPHLPEGQRTEVMAEVLWVARQNSAEARLSLTEESLMRDILLDLVTMAPQLPEAQRSEVLTAALAVARRISDEKPRLMALAALAPELPEAQRSEVLAGILAAARQSRWEHAEVLAALTPQLPEAQRAEVLAEALAAARRNSLAISRSEELAVLAPHLPKAQRAAVLAEALAAAWQIGGGWERDWRYRSKALGALAPLLPEGLLIGTLAAVRKISDEEARLAAVVALAPHMPDAQRTEVLTKALAATLSVIAVFFVPHGRSNLVNPSRAIAELAALASQLPQDQLAEALAAARQISDDFPRSEALAALAPHLPEALLGEAVAAAREISEGIDRSELLAALVPQLPEAQRAEVLAEALAAARQTNPARSKPWRALAALLPDLPEALLAEALTAARQIGYGIHRSMALAAFVPCLPEAQRADVLAEALAASRETSYDSAHLWALAALAPYLPEPQRTDVLAEALAGARKISFGGDRSRALAALAPQLTKAQQPEVLAEALAAARQITNEPYRSEYILTIASHTASLSRNEQTQLWRECLRSLASQGRQPILNAQEHLLRLLERLTGVDVSAEVAEIAHAIRDVGRWFP